MGDDRKDTDGAKINALAAGIRIDLIIAICALLASSLATAASWWQTRIIEAQLSAQTWPIVQITTTASPDTIVVRFDNPGLGPAILRGLSVSVDNKPAPDMIAVMHALIGPKIRARKPKGEAFTFTRLNPSEGVVIRAGDSLQLVSLQSKHFVPALTAGLARIKITVCYCAIIPGTCWLTTDEDPKPVTACPRDAADWLRPSSDADTSKTIAL